MKLTKSRIDALCPGGAERLYWDDELKGFGLRLSPKGRKTFFVQYRSDGRTRRAKIGAMGAVTPDQARLMARSLLGGVASGDDPAELRRRRRMTPTVTELCDRFTEEHVKVRLKPRTQVGYLQLIRDAIIPALGAIKVTEVTRVNISALHQSYSDQPYKANRVLACARFEGHRDKVFHSNWRLSWEDEGRTARSSSGRLSG